MTSFHDNQSREGQDESNLVLAVHTMTLSSPASPEASFTLVNMLIIRAREVRNFVES